MLAGIRAFAKSPFATFLLGLLVISFGVWGIKDVFNSSTFSDAVVKAGARPPINSVQFKDIFDQEKTRREQEAHQTLSVDEAVKYGLDRSIVDGLASAEASGALMQAEGVNPADKLIADEIRKVQAFFNPVTGQFDPQTYARLLAQRHMTEVQADNEFRDTIAQRQYIAGLAAGLKAPRIYGLVQAAFQQEGRDFGYFVIEPKVVGDVPKPTDAQLNDFIKQNAVQLTKPEMRVLSLVHFSAVNLAQTIAAPEAEVQKRFNFEKDTLSTPEKRTVIQMTVKDAKMGQAVAQKLKAGEDPTAIAKDTGATANSYQQTPKSAIADSKLASAAFALKDGEVSAPIQGDLGLAVLKVTAITPGKDVTLNEARAKIEGEVKQEQAKEKIYDLVQKYDDTHSGGADMAASAKASDQQVATLPPLMAQGATLQGQRANLPPQVLQTAFTLPAGGESDVMDLGQGEYWVVHVDRVLPPALFTLDEQVGPTKVRDAISRQFMLKALFDRLKAKADGLVAEIKGGKSLDAAAAEVGAKVVQANNVLRSAAQPAAPGQPTPYTADLLGQLFQAKVGDVVQGQDTRPGLIVARLEKVQEAPAPQLAGRAEAARIPVTRALFDDLGGAVRLAALRKIKPKVDYSRARQALGVDAAAAGSAPAGHSPAR